MGVTVSQIIPVGVHEAMDMGKTLEALRKKQQEVLDGIDCLSDYYKDSSIENENEQLRQELKKHLAELDVINRKYDALHQENLELRLALQE